MTARIMGRFPGVLAALVGVSLVVSPVAWAHEEQLPAKTLVQQAIALSRGQPEQREAIADKIHDAIESEQKAGVDIDRVREAEEAFDASRLHQAWDLLEVSIGAAPHRVVATPNPGPALPAPAEVVETPPALHEGALEEGLQGPNGVFGWVVLAAAATLALAGLVVVTRVR